MQDRLTALHKPLIALSILALLAALWLGLVRLPWVLPSLAPLGPLAHGPLMVAGFLGTLIGVERASALRRPWMYGGPILTALGAVLLMAGLTQPGAILMTLGSAIFVALFIVMLRQHHAPYVVSMSLGAVAWLVGNVLWIAGWSIPQVVLWWMGYLVLTIAGERLELSRVLRPTPLSRNLYIIVIAVFLIGLLATTFAPMIGARIAGVALIALGGWLLVFDIARRTARQTGLTRFIALALLSGYVWLIVGGALMVILGAHSAGYLYDAMLHAVFVGFVMSMIFGHAPIILPAVTDIEMPYRPRFYAHLVLLHASLILRVAGDLLIVPDARRWGGLLNVVAILLFMANTAFAAARGKSSEQS